MENSITIKAIKDLADYSFYIPSYQRGYRWKQREVEDLLNDIDAFTAKDIEGKNEKTWYCLQPLVVKKREGLGYEVIDGQQRLTTIYLILYYLQLKYQEQYRKPLFIMTYQTRKDYLSHPDISDPTQDDINGYYIEKAYKVILNWFLAKGPSFDEEGYKTKLQSQTKFIWYEVCDEDVITVFKRLNIGKISLTDSELVKALFLNSSNYKSKAKETMQLKQREIANEWDMIERSLQEETFWCFLSNNVGLKYNRIEYIFKMISNNINNGEEISSFSYFENKLIRGQYQPLVEAWNDIQSHYQHIYDWYNNDGYYHKIGFILSMNISSINVLYSQSLTMGKQSFYQSLDQIIKDSFQKINLDDLEYSDDQTLGVLLLYNILTVLHNNQKTMRFPFDLYKKQKWNKEHISAKHILPPNIKDREDWVREITPYLGIDDVVIPSIITLYMNNPSLYTDDQLFQSFFNAVNDYFAQNDDSSVDSISNLALLDEQTNKSYKDDVFPLKRQIIINKDKQGVFIPICTKNVFLKYYSTEPIKRTFWTEEDRLAYLNDMKSILNGYVKG